MEHYMYFVDNLDTLKIKKWLVTKTLLMNVTKTNKHSNVTTFFYAIVCCTYCTELVAHFKLWLVMGHTYVCKTLL